MAKTLSELTKSIKNARKMWSWREAEVAIELINEHGNKKETHTMIAQRTGMSATVIPALLTEIRKAAEVHPDKTLQQYFEMGRPLSAAKRQAPSAK